jgi:hypothetical protein
MLYAFIRNGNVVEYNLTEEMLAARGVNKSLFAECLDTDKPAVSFWEYLTPRPVALNDKLVIINYELGDWTFQMCMRDLRTQIQLTKEHNEESSDFRMSVLRARQIYRKHLVPYLNMHANYSRYADFETMVSYASSKVAQYREEAEKAIKLKEALYAGFDVFIQSATKDEVNIPESFQEVYDIVLKYIAQE